MKLGIVGLAPFVLCLCAGCGPLVGDESLELSAPRTSLRIGESVQLKVEKKGTWFRNYDLEVPSRTEFGTTSESALVVEPDGKITCIGTYNRKTESAIISAWNGPSRGHLTLDLLEDGPGPTLDIAANSSVPLPTDARSAFVPCCSEPLVLNEGQQLSYTIRERSSGRNLTSTATGTRYTMFFGSGIPNDQHPSVITGGPNYVTAETFLVDSQNGIIKASDSIGRLNRARVIVFVRNGELVGWREVVIIHPGGRLGQD